MRDVLIIVTLLCNIWRLQHFISSLICVFHWSHRTLWSDSPSTSQTGLLCWFLPLSRVLTREYLGTQPLQPLNFSAYIDSFDHLSSLMTFNTIYIHRWCPNLNFLPESLSLTHTVVNDCLLNISNKHLRLKCLKHTLLTKWKVLFSSCLGQNLAVILEYTSFLIPHVQSISKFLGLLHLQHICRTLGTFHTHHHFCFCSSHHFPWRLLKSPPVLFWTFIFHFEVYLNIAARVISVQTSVKSCLFTKCSNGCTSHLA